jgi:hypothetical protein
VAVVAAGCSGTDGTELDAAGTTGAPDGVAPTSTAADRAAVPGTDPDGDGGADEPAEDGGGGRIVTAPSIVTVPETGVPGLDSDDRFCAAWSRFAGSFQVIAVTAAFGEGPPEQVDTLEVLAAPVVVDAYDELLAAWPDELAAEEDVARDDLLGPLTTRLREGVRALGDAGASEADLAAVEEAWLTALAARDPSTPEFAVDLPDGLWEVVDEAAALFGERTPAFADDDRLVTDADTPMTDEYLALTCPDQGTLAGGEVGG